MTTPDYLTLLFYLVGLFVISTVSAKRTTNQSDMFSAASEIALVGFGVERVHDDVLGCNLRRVGGHRL